MKKTIGIITTLIIIAGGIKFYTAPMSTMAEIEDGLKNKDVDKIAEHIDFEKLRANIKEQRMDGVLMATMGGRMVDGILNTYLTKSGLAKTLENSNKNKIFKDIKYNGSFESLDKYKLILTKKEDDKKIPIILKRYGLFDWKVVEMTLPKN